jgi:hypothetical protein
MAEAAAPLTATMMTGVISQAETAAGIGTAMIMKDNMFWD